jgi:hypothetical protein
VKHAADAAADAHEASHAHQQLLQAMPFGRLLDGPDEPGKRYSLPRSVFLSLTLCSFSEEDVFLRTINN